MKTSITAWRKSSFRFRRSEIDPATPTGVPLVWTASTTPQTFDPNPTNNDASVTVWLDLSQEKDVEDVYTSTGAYADGRYVDIDDTVTENYAVAHSFVSPLSIPYVLESFVPQLAAAVDGDPATQVPAPAE